MRCDSCTYWGIKELDAGAHVAGTKMCSKAIELWEASKWVEIDEDPLPIRELKPEYNDQKMFVMDGSSYKAALHTTADFFCAHYKVKL